MSRHLGRWGSLVAMVALSALVGCAGSAPGKPDGGGGKGGGGGAAATDGGLGGETAGTSGSAGGAGTTDNNPDAAAGTSGGEGGAIAGAGGAPAGGGGAAAGAGGTTAGVGVGTAGAGGSSGGGGGTTGAAGGTAGAAGGGSAGAGGAAGGFQPPTSGVMFDVSTDIDPVAPGGRVRYTVRVGNVSTHAVDGVTVSLLLPTGLQFNGVNDSAPNGTGCSFNNCTSNSQATWTLGSLAAGASRTIVINAQVLQTVGDGEKITTTFKLAATNFNTVTFNKVVQVHGGSASQLATGTATYPLTPGKRFTLDLDFGQLGMTALAGTTLQATFAPGLTVASISDGGTQASATAPVVWGIGAVGVGAALHRQVDLTVDAGVAAGALLTTRATLTYDGGLDVDAAAEYTLAIVDTTPILAFSVATASNPALPGRRLAYRATVGNLGTRAVDGISVSLLVPSGLAFSGTGDSAPDGAGCYFNNCVANSEITWSVGSLAAGASATIDLNANVVANMVGNGNVIRSLFSLAATGVAEIEDVKTVQIFDSPAAQLALTATANPVTNAQAFTYNLDIGQIGATALASTELRARLPAGLTVGAISDGGAKAASGDIVWTIGSVAVGATLRRTVAVTGDGTAAPGALLKAAASLTYAGGADVDNLVGYDIAVLSAAQPLTLTVSVNANPAVPGTHDLYTATITNTAARALNGVGLFLRVPVGLSFNGVNDADPDATGCYFNNCTAGSESTWTIGTLAANGTQMITLNPQVLNTLLAGSLVNTPFWLYSTGQAAPIFVDLVIPTHP